MQKLLSTKEVAEHLGFTPSTIRKMRMRKNQAIYNFPKGIKIGTSFRYEKEEIEHWLESWKAKSF